MHRLPPPVHPLDLEGQETGPSIPLRVEVAPVGGLPMIGEVAEPFPEGLEVVPGNDEGVGGLGEGNGREVLPLRMEEEAEDLPLDQPQAPFAFNPVRPEEELEDLAGLEVHPAPDGAGREIGLPAQVTVAELLGIADDLLIGDLQEPEAPMLDLLDQGVVGWKGEGAGATGAYPGGQLAIVGRGHPGRGGVLHHRGEGAVVEGAGGAQPAGLDRLPDGLQDCLVELVGKAVGEGAQDLFPGVAEGADAEGAEPLGGGGGPSDVSGSPIDQGIVDGPVGGQVVLDQGQEEVGHGRNDPPLGNDVVDLGVGPIAVGQEGDIEELAVLDGDGVGEGHSGGQPVTGGHEACQLPDPGEVLGIVLDPLPLALQQRVIGVGEGQEAEQRVLVARGGLPQQVGDIPEEAGPGPPRQGAHQDDHHAVAGLISRQGRPGLLVGLEEPLLEVIQLEVKQDVARDTLPAQAGQRVEGRSGDLGGLRGGEPGSDLLLRGAHLLSGDPLEGRGGGDLRADEFG